MRVCTSSRGQIIRILHQIIRQNHTRVRETSIRGNLRGMIVAILRLIIYICINLLSKHLDFSFIITSYVSALLSQTI